MHAICSSYWTKTLRSAGHFIVKKYACHTQFCNIKPWSWKWFAVNNLLIATVCAGGIPQNAILWSHSTNFSDIWGYFTGTPCGYILSPDLDTVCQQGWPSSGTDGFFVPVPGQLVAQSQTAFTLLIALPFSAHQFWNHFFLPLLSSNLDTNGKLIGTTRLIEASDFISWCKL